MKKPVKLTGKALDAVIAKRKHKLITVTKRLPSGNIDDIYEAVEQFANENDVYIEHVKISNGSWYKAMMTVRREETDEEKAKRVRSEEHRKYELAKYKYDQWLYEKNRAEARAASYNVQTKSVVCCKKCGCSCCN